MADNSRWFKLWCSAPADDDLQALPPAIRWAWAAFGAYTKQHGSSGKVLVRDSNAALAAQMGVSLSELIDVIKMLPNMDVMSDENRHGTFSVTWHNWRKYQEDSTAAKRQESRRKKRREEMRRDEKRRDEKRRDIPQTPKGADGWDQFWEQYPKKVGKGAAENSWNKIRPSEQLCQTILQALAEQKRSAQWAKDRGSYIPNPATWLNQKRWNDDLSTIQDDEEVDPIWTRNLTIAK